MTVNETAPGRPWTVVGTFPSFEAASSRAEIERSIKGQQVKVKRISEGFTVRTRRDVSPLQKQVTAEAPPAADAKRPKLKAKDRRSRDRQATDSEE